MNTYKPEDVEILVNGHKFEGYADDFQFKQPWYRVVQYAKDHPDYSDDSTRINIELENGLSSSFKLFNNSESLKYILSLDPYDSSLARKTFKADVEITPENYIRLADGVE